MADMPAVEISGEVYIQEMFVWIWKVIEHIPTGRGHHKQTLKLVGGLTKPHLYSVFHPTETDG